MNKTFISLFQLMRFDKPIGIMLLLWPTLMALWIGVEGVPPFKWLMIFILGVVLMRAAGCVINDLTDVVFDKDVERTRQRPLVVGAISKSQALSLWFFLMALGLFIASFLSWKALGLAVIAAFLMIFYPRSKRLTHLPQVVLGLAFSMGMLMALIEMRTFLVWSDAYWLLANVLWVIAYDTCYALADREDDRKIGVRSTAILFGDLAVFWVAALQVMALFFWAKAGWALGLGVEFFAALLMVLLLFIRQLQLIAGAFPARCMEAFRLNQWVGLVLFLSMVWVYR